MPLYFIRHGESQANSEGFLAGQLDLPITPKGIMQAKVAGSELKKSKLSIDVIVSSPLSRAYDTAVCLAREIGYPISQIILDPRLMERHMGILQGQPVESAKILDTLDSAGQEKLKMETEAALMQRAGEALRYLESLKGAVLAVSHNGLGRRMIAFKYGVTSSATQKLPNAKVVDLTDKELLLN